ncbi:MAG: arylsulfotransferase family protein, partial [Chloroflexota bacterium]|nr:arylsulfotransferase family protein [Chloroflexota bacterium]
TPFRLQHDARVHADGYLSLFDNATENADSDIESRGMVLELDEDPMTATLVREYLHPDGIVAVSQANTQMLANGNVFIGWGSAPVSSEFTEEGELLFDARFPSGVNSYRAYRYEWTGQPIDSPDVLAEAGANGSVTVYVSWNGATGVASWQVLAGPDAAQLQPATSVARDGFETAIPVQSAEPYFAVQALDASGSVLSTSETVQAVG